MDQKTKTLDASLTGLLGKLLKREIAKALVDKEVKMEEMAKTALVEKKVRCFKNLIINYNGNYMWFLVTKFPIQIFKLS